MKRISTQLMIMALCLSVSFVACKKEDKTTPDNKPTAQDNGNDDGDGGNNAAPFMTFKANGADRDLSKSSSARFIAGMGIIKIKGDFKGKNADEIITITFPDTLKTKSYSLIDMAGFINMNYQKDGKGGASETYIGQTGTITISKIDKKSKEKEVSGAFSFTAIDFNAMDTMVVTNGKFHFKK